MGLPRFRKIHSTAEELNQVQDNIRSVLDPLALNPILDSVFIPSVSLATGSNAIGHGLGRRYVSYLIGMQSAVADITVGASPNRATTLVLVASAPTTCDLYVF